MQVLLLAQFVPSIFLGQDRRSLDSCNIDEFAEILKHYNILKYEHTFGLYSLLQRVIHPILVALS